MASKRKHKTLSINILSEIGKKSYAVLAAKYGVARSTIADIKKKANELQEHKQKLVDLGL